ncbi:ADP-ribosylglycohydrolase [Coraliomargarita sinensis]|uniref:ADP-ribosylglycohydrolase n=1 Tax=Coraliomargarita sinensis TaxID=2174842 RepID=A0A317ZHK1_9BACT|nr:ADP-ribosylglycohydrolase family protein [Coraliomargarita sinensis]PXA05045.1 ADP-ribosylglycohydrolase [Coraliomargarita sinensis]
MNDRLQNAMLGALVADAVSMPVHWYYDRNALDRDYPNLETYQAPKNPHPDSILWRSKYTPRNKDADILHEQAKYWGQKGVHYHQFLPAGDNTVNFLLGAQLYRSTVATGKYDPDAWLEIYINSLRTPGWHADTYLEEYHRAFFDNLARGKKPAECGIKDIHIGGLTPVPFLLAALDAIGETSLDADLPTVEAHLALTHHGSEIASTGRAFTRMLHALASGTDLRAAIIENASECVSEGQLDTWAQFEDRDVVGRYLTTACYLPDSFTASLYLAWKYHDDFSAGVIANARCGGDNAHRGAVVGALLAAANDIPEQWLKNLKSMERLRCDTLKPTF